MQVFPHILVRLAARPFEAIGSSSGFVENYIHEREVIKRELENTKEILVKKLFVEISSQHPGEVTKVLLNLKRDVFNHRRIRISEAYKQISSLQPSTVEMLDSYTQLQQSLTSLDAEFVRTFDKALLTSKESLFKFTEDDCLLNGLLLSSHSLLKEISGHGTRFWHARAFSSKISKTELALLKYISRICAKTSPFSTFNSLHLASLEIERNIIRHTRFRSACLSHVRPNNHLLKFLKAVIIDDAELRKTLPIALNSTVSLKDGQFTFLTNDNNVESFQSLEANLLESILFEHLNSGTALKYLDDVVERCFEEIDETKDDITAYIVNLIEAGFVEFVMPVSGTNPGWHKELLQFYLPYAEKGIAPAEVISSLLKELVALTDQYSNSSHPQRKMLLNRAYDTILTSFSFFSKQVVDPRDAPSRNELTADEDPGSQSEENWFRHHRPSAFHFKKEHLIYEDAVAGIECTIDNETVQRFAGKVEDLVKNLSLFTSVGEERYRLAGYFADKYGTQASVAVLDFYYNYYKDVKTQRANKKGQAEGNLREKIKEQSYAETLVAERRQLIDKWIDELSLLLKNYDINSDYINLPMDDLRLINSRLTVNADTFHSTSTSILVQLFKDNCGPEEILKGVLNLILPGYGKIYSRFLHLFDDDVTHQLKTINEASAKNEIYAEATDSSYFNGNIHPQLLPYEVRMPGSNNSLPSESQIDISRVKVQLDSGSKSLFLFDSVSGRRLYMFDLGIQAYQGRSKLYQLLATFATSFQISTIPILNTINKLFITRSPGKSVVMLPRIAVDEIVIIQRKSWMVNIDVIPRKAEKTSDMEYFLTLNQWRLKQDIDAQIFLTLLPSPLPSEKHKLTREDLKPQYINFNDPVFCRLFEKILTKGIGQVTLTEVYPGKEHLVKIEDRGYFSEYVIQWYNDEAGNQ